MSREFEAMQRGERPVIPAGQQALCSILQHEGPQFRELLPDEFLQSIEFTDFRGLEDAHKSSDVVFFDTLCKLSSPSKSYMDYVDFIKHPDLEYETNPISPRKTDGYSADTIAWLQSFQNPEPKSPIPKMTSAYLKGFSASRCTNTGTIVYTPKYNAGEYSPYSKAVSVRSSANRLASQVCKIPDLVQDLKGMNLLGMDLTFPKEVSLIALTDPRKAIQIADKSYLIFRKELIKSTSWIQRKDQKLGGCSNIHIWHSHDPKHPNKPISTPDEPHLHVHSNIINLVVGGPPGNRDYIRFSPIMDRELVQKCWSYAIFKACGFMVAEPVLFLHFIPLHQRAQVAQRLRYCGRSPLNDLFNYYQDNDFSENIPIQYNEFLIDYSNRRRVFGFLRFISELVEDVDGDTVCAVCASSSEKLDPVYVWDMVDKVKLEGIPVAIYQSDSKTVTIIRNRMAKPVTDPPDSDEVFRVVTDPPDPGEFISLLTRAAELKFSDNEVKYIITKLKSIGEIIEVSDDIYFVV